MDVLTVIKCKTSCKLFTLRRRGVVGLLTSGQTDYTMDSRITTFMRSYGVHHAHDPSTPLHCAIHRLFVFVSAVTALLISQLLSPVTAAHGPPGAAMLSVRQSCGRTDVSLVAAADLSAAFAAPVMWEVFAVMSGLLR